MAKEPKITPGFSWEIVYLVIDGIKLNRLTVKSDGEGREMNSVS